MANRMKGETPESPIKRAVLQYLRLHPNVAWVERINTGTARLKGFYVKFGFVGCADIIGQMRDGRFLAIETKALTGTATKEQAEFLDRVEKHRGVAGICRSVEDAEALLGGKR